MYTFFFFSKLVNVAYIQSHSIVRRLRYIIVLAGIDITPGSAFLVFVCECVLSVQKAPVWHTEPGSNAA